LLDDPLVVDDLVADIHGRAVFLEREFDDLYGAFDAGAEASGLRKNHQHARPTFPLNVTATSQRGYTPAPSAHKRTDQQRPNVNAVPYIDAGSKYNRAGRVEFAHDR